MEPFLDNNDRPLPSTENLLASAGVSLMNALPSWLRTLFQIGLGEGLFRLGTTVLTIVLIAAALWLLELFFEQAPSFLRPVSALIADSTAPLPPTLDRLPPATDTPLLGLARSAQPHTIIPTRPRQEILKYVVQPGDTVFGIAEKFGLKPQTILWGNYNILADDPHALRPGQELNILPVDGVYHEWLGGINFEAWARYFGVTARDIIEYPGNKLDPDAVGDYTNPNIPRGTWLIIPGGRREFTTWNAPFGISRNDPAIARAWGPGACGPVQGGAVGYGSYVWPTGRRYLSGYDYSPETNHWGIDLAGQTGDPVYAADAGVVVYAGWHDGGYGNMIMIDHGDNWQSLYAHLSSIWVSCGESVGRGQTIGAIGSTGRSSGAHLHFELMHGSYKVNPWNFLPPP